MNWNNWNQALPGILLLGLVIFVHELGHFLMAKWRGVRVLRFSLGFGPKLVGFTHGGTEYQLSWIPLGGYVQMAGDTPDAEDHMPGGHDEFLTHPWFGRVLIAVAGPAANLVTAFLLLVLMAFIGLSQPDYPSVVGAVSDTSVAHALGLREGDRLVSVDRKPATSLDEVSVLNSAIPKTRAVEVGVERNGNRLLLNIPAPQRGMFFANLRPPAEPPIIGAVATGMPAYKAGLKEGDRIVAVAGHPIASWDQLPQAFRGQVDKQVTLTVERDGRRFEVSLKPMDPEGRGTENGRIGIEAPSHGKYIQRFGALGSLKFGARETVNLVASVYAGMWLAISNIMRYHEYLGGPVFIAQVAQQQAKRGLDAYLWFIAYINAAIMAFNLLPLPVLDGGHILLAVIEAIRRRAISTRGYVRFQKAGLAVLVTLLVLVFSNDSVRLLQRHHAIDQQSTPAGRPAAPVNP